MIALNETNEYAAEVAFTLPLDSDPLTGLTGYTFILGEVQIKLPGQAWADAALSKIVEKGYGRFCVRLTSSQTTSPGDVFIRADISGTQYYFGSDVIGTLGGDIAVGATTGSVSFFLPLASDPVNGAPLTGHTFTLGQVRVCLPDGAYVDASTAQIEEIGFGGYRLNLTAGQLLKRGKVFVHALVPLYQRWEGYCTILDAQGAEEEEPVTPPVPVPVPIVYGDPEYVDQLGLALNRLPQQFRSGTLDYTITAQLSELLGVFTPGASEETVFSGEPDAEFDSPFDFAFGGGFEIEIATHLAAALNRLPQQFRSGTLVYDLPITTTPQEVAGVYVPTVIEYEIVLPVVDDPGTTAHLTQALNRLPQQFRSGTLYG